MFHKTDSAPARAPFRPVFQAGPVDGPSREASACGEAVFSSPGHASRIPGIPPRKTLPGEGTGTKRSAKQLLCTSGTPRIPTATRRRRRRDDDDDATAKPGNGFRLRRSFHVSRARVPSPLQFELGYGTAGSGSVCPMCCDAQGILHTCEFFGASPAARISAHRNLLIGGILRFGEVAQSVIPPILRGNLDPPRAPLDRSPPCIRVIRSCSNKAMRSACVATFLLAFWSLHTRTRAKLDWLGAFLLPYGSSRTHPATRRRRCDDARRDDGDDATTETENGS